MALQDPEQEKLLQPKKKKPKYGNTKVELDGIEFDSIAEAAHYIHLKDLEQRKEIRELRIKPCYKFACGTKYYPDFAYQTRTKRSFKWRTEVVDVKGGALTQSFSIKRRMLRAEYHLEIKIVRYKAEISHAIVKSYIGKTRRDEK